MRNTVSYLFLILVAGAIAGLFYMATPDPHPKVRLESDEILRLNQEIRYRDAVIRDKDAIIRRQAEIIAAKRE